MTSRTSRLARSARWGIPAILALTGAAAAQSETTTTTQTWSTTDLTDWRRADFVPAFSSAPLTILQKESDTGKCVCVAIDRGQVVGLQIDNQDASLDRVQIKGNKIRVTDENKSQAIATLGIPQNPSTFARAGQRDDTYSRNFNRDQDPQRFYPQNDRWTTDRGYAQNQGYQDRGNGADRWSSTPDRNGQPDRYSYSERTYQERQTPDRWSDDRSAPRDRWTYSSDRSAPRFYPAEPPRGYTRSEYPQDSGDYRYSTPRPDQTWRSDQPAEIRYRPSTMGTTERYYNADFQHPILGVMMTEADQNDLTSARASGRYSSGIIVDQVNAGLPAERAGLQKGDLIVSVDGQQPVTAEFLRDTLARKEFGDTLRLGVLRSGQDRNVTVRLTRPDGTTFNRNYYSPESGTEIRNAMPQQVPGDPNATYDPPQRYYYDSRERMYYNEQETFRPRN